MMKNYLMGVAPSQYMPAVLMCNYSWTYFGGTAKWEEGCKIVTKRGTYATYDEINHLKFLDNEILDVQLPDKIIEDANDLLERMIADGDQMLDSEEPIARETTEQDIQHTLQMYIEDRLQHLQARVQEAVSRLEEFDCRPKALGLPHIWLSGMFDHKDVREVWGMPVHETNVPAVFGDVREGAHYAWVQDIEYRRGLPSDELALMGVEA